ncbi:hypothetical protein Tco_0211460 [Tanacetum coccineum]
MESLRRNFFNGFQEGDRKIAWVKWSKVLASKKFRGLGVSSFFSSLSIGTVFFSSGYSTNFWKDLWIGDNLLKLSFPRLFALEENKDISVADKMNTSISSSFRRHVRGGMVLGLKWRWVLQVKDVRSMLMRLILP